jgi:hypothetical protein
MGPGLEAELQPLTAYAHEPSTVTPTWSPPPLPLLPARTEEGQIWILEEGATGAVFFFHPPFFLLFRCCNVWLG